MSRVCELTGKHARKGSIIWRSGKAKKLGGIGTHITAITKRKFQPNLQRVKAVVNGEVRYIRVAVSAIKKGLVIKPMKRTWKKEDVKPEAKVEAKPAPKTAPKTAPNAAPKTARKPGDKA
jgi:large subunit ribosomal protein L28